MSALARIAGPLLAAALLAGAAGAAPRGVLDAVFPPGEPVCYAARFEAAQLAAHPDQSVVALRLMRGYPSLRRGEETADDGDMPNLPATLIVTFRDAGRNGAPRQFGAEVSCAAADGQPGVRCGIACDGGGFVATRESGGALRLAIEDGRTLRIAGGCTNHRDHRALGDQAGDRVFTLTRQPIEACR
jgi:hypothetical protein